jgi:hypothetical protein
MIRRNEYEVAFDAYLRHYSHSRLAVDETRRSAGLDGPLKSPDFVVVTPGGKQWIIDVKGRKFPSGSANGPSYTWQNWVTQSDIDSLIEWQTMLGPRSQAIFLFAYRLSCEVELPLGTADLWYWKEERYLFRAVGLEDYRTRMRIRSEKWQTVGLPVKEFREIVTPFCRLIDEEIPISS